MSGEGIDLVIEVFRHDIRSKVLVRESDLLFGGPGRKREIALISVLYAEAAVLPAAGQKPHVRIDSVHAARVTVLPRRPALLLPDAAAESAQLIGERLCLDALDVDAAEDLIRHVFGRYFEAARRPVRHGVVPLRAAEPEEADIDADQLGPGRPCRVRYIRPATSSEEAELARLGEAAREALV